MRPLTNLKQNSEFKLPKAKQRTGFIAAYQSNVGMPAYDFMFDLCTRLLYSWTRGKNADVNSKSIKDFIDSSVKDPNRRYVVKSVLKKNLLQKRLEFKAPIFHCNALGDRYLVPGGSWVSAFKPQAINGQENDLTLSVKTIDDTPFAGGTILTGRQVASICQFSGRTKEVVENSILSVEASIENDRFVMWATWIISKEEAEYLNNVPFAQIKLGNLYPTLIEWAANCIGKDVNLPDTICPISTIASDVAKVLSANPVQPRVGLYNAVVDVHRDLYVIPEVNNALEYEQKLLEFGTQEDGSYTWGASAHGPETIDEIRVGQGQIVKKKLPANIPIFTDWLNDKFVYSNSSGNLSVYDLSNTAPVNNFHINYLLSSPVVVSDRQNMSAAQRTITTAINLASSFDSSILKYKPDANEVGIDNEALQKILRTNYTDFYEVCRDAYKLHFSLGSTEDLYVGPNGGPTARLHQLNSKNGLPAFRFVGRMLDKALEVLKANIEVMYTRYSVMNVLRMLATLGVTVEYGHRYPEVKAADEQERDVYVNQGVDPNHPVESLPGIKKGLKYLPHQAKVQNMMRRGPKLAIWPVDAGGGKTIITLTNILHELKAKRCVRPIICCPAHLVSQYVKEVVFVTEGRLNLIPVTNASFKAHGEEKLANLIQKAPINTVVITDYDFLKGRRQRVAYGNKTLTIYRNAEFMRQFEFDLVVLDESHYLKNLKSARRDAAARFVQDIPMKRLASGTLISDTLKDLVSQFALLDPIVFGSEEIFKEEFAAQQRGSKVMSWREGAETEIRKRMAEHCVVAGARRKEWAALLPPKEERFLGVELTKNQRLLYESILAETMELIRDAMARDAEVRELMESNDDSKAEELEAKLRPYLARLERFMSAPEADPAAQLFLKDEEDLISPKVKKIYEICREHLNKNIEGKVLIFTQYTASAEAVYNNAPDDLKPMFILYKAAEKMEARSEYENNPNKKFMVGVSSSMDTGLNFQFVSRLIRMETVWTPGVLEQGNSRINRPEMKKAEERKRIYFDWLVINKTIDITKVSRLISKLVSKAKFDEYDNPAYQAIPDVPQVAMTLESIAAFNDFKEELLPYLEAYQTYQQVEEEEYRKYKEEQGENIIPVDVPQDKLLEGSKLLSRVPYVPDMELYGADKLGLIRYDHFVRQDLSELEEDIEDSESDDEDDGEDLESVDPKDMKKAAIKAALQKERALMRGRAVHTDFGDGTITGLGLKRVRVRLSNGTVVRLPKLQVYVITRSTTNGIDMRNELLKQVGAIPLDQPIVVPVEEGVQDKKRKQKAKVEKTKTPKEPIGPTAEFDFTVINDFLALMYRGDGSDSDVVSILQNFGFRITPEYVYTKIPGPQTMLRFAKALAAAKFTLTLPQSAELKRIYLALRTNKKAMNTFGFATKMEITDFFKQQIKPSSDPHRLLVFPLVQDGQLYLIFPIKGQAANQKVTKVQVSGVRWKRSSDMELIRIFSNKAEAKDTIKDMLEAGLIIPEANLAELGQQFKSISLVRR